MLAQHVFALGAAHLGLHLFANLALDLHGLCSAVHFLPRAPQPRDHVEFFEESLLRSDVELEVRSHEIREAARLLDVHREHL